jgi:hypothetical protein
VKKKKYWKVIQSLSNDKIKKKILVLELWKAIGTEERVIKTHHFEEKPVDENGDGEGDTGNF